VSVPAPSARLRFAAMVQGAERELDLATGALLIAAEEYPQLPTEPYLRRLDVLAERVRDRLSDETAPLVLLQELSRVLFEEEGFRGNSENYYDPRNSFLNDVLDRRLGIPITLSVVYLEVGWRLGLPLEGVNFPGHFLVRYEGEALRILVDPFQGGDLRFEGDAQALLDRLSGGSVPMQPHYLRPAGKRDILARILSNIKEIYLKGRDEVRALAAVERLQILRPEDAEERRDRGFILARLGREAEARSELLSYLDRTPDAADAPRVRLLLDQLKREV
jgi:regulator of sirC expression with transglutaminase-like and TPR domain